MGFWKQVSRTVTDVLRESGSGSKAGSKPKAKAKARQPVTPESERGPDPGTLVSADEIERATGSRPVGEGDRKSGGSENDTGFFRVCIWALADGGELLLNFTRLRGAEGEELWRSRWDDPSWHTDGERPLDGLGEVAKWYVTRSHRGGTELHVTAKQGTYQSQLVHTSPSGAKDISALSDLMATVLTRLQDA